MTEQFLAAAVGVGEPAVLVEGEDAVGETLCRLGGVVAGGGVDDRPHEATRGAAARRTVLSRRRTVLLRHHRVAPQLDGPVARPAVAGAPSADAEAAGADPAVHDGVPPAGPQFVQVVRAHPGLDVLDGAPEGPGIDPEDGQRLVVGRARPGGQVPVEEADPDARGGGGRDPYADRVGVVLHGLGGRERGEAGARLLGGGEQGALLRAGESAAGHRAQDDEDAHHFTADRDRFVGGGERVRQPGGQLREPAHDLALVGEPQPALGAVRLGDGERATDRHPPPGPHQGAGHPGDHGEHQ
ncbi:hypothetical protein [Streptomyces sp. GC420]|uniref:hypothetical protein n=1 Tax=Streptomyces sp. GC420 TaxID=2697568 RepID=UPI0028BE6C7A|nr:hypothetical protein [Streptomyces sp. GC420]